MLLGGYAVEHRMIETLALYLPKLDPGMIPDLKKRLAAIPEGMTTAESLATEEQYFLDWFIRTVKKAKDKESLLAVLAFIDNEPEGGPRGSGDKARAFLEECGGSVEGVLRRSEETRRVLPAGGEDAGPAPGSVREGIRSRGEEASRQPGVQGLLSRRRPRCVGPGTDGSPPGIAVGRPRRSGWTAPMP